MQKEETLKYLLNDQYNKLNNLHKYVNFIYRKKKKENKGAYEWRKQFNMANIKEQKLLIKRLLKLMNDGEVIKGDK